MLKLENKEYKQCLLKKLALPNRESFYESIEVCLGFLFGFCDMIEDSLKAEEDEGVTFDYLADSLKPTARFYK